LFVEYILLLAPKTDICECGEIKIEKEKHSDRGKKETMKKRKRKQEERKK
jgi:hypothetical protein